MSNDINDFWTFDSWITIPFEKYDSVFSTPKTPASSKKQARVQRKLEQIEARKQKMQDDIQDVDFS